MGREVRVRVAVCATRRDTMLLVQHEKDGRRYWLLPGGGVEAGETLVTAAAREVEEETGYAARVGRLLLLCEVIEPGGRHLVNLVYQGSLPEGEPRLGSEPVLRAARWVPRSELAGLAMRPPINAALEAAWAEGFTGEVRVLGNVWRPEEDLTSAE